MINSYFDKAFLLPHGRKAFSAFKSLDKKKTVKPHFTGIQNNVRGQVTQTLTQAILTRQLLHVQVLQGVCFRDFAKRCSSLEDVVVVIDLSPILLQQPEHLSFQIPNLRGKKPICKTLNQHLSPSARQAYSLIKWL